MTAPDYIWAEEPDIFDGCGFWMNDLGRKRGQYIRHDAAALAASPLVQAMIADAVRDVTAERDQWIKHTQNAVWAEGVELKIADAEVARLTSELANMRLNASQALIDAAELIAELNSTLSRESLVPDWLEDAIAAMRSAEGSGNV